MNQLGEYPILGDEFIERALFRNHSLVEHKNTIGLIESGQPMGNHDYGVALPRVIDGSANLALADVVQGGSPFIQD